MKGEKIKMALAACQSPAPPFLELGGTSLWGADLSPGPAVQGQRGRQCRAWTGGNLERRTEVKEGTERPSKRWGQEAAEGLPGSRAHVRVGVGALLGMAASK